MGCIDYLKKIDCRLKTIFISVVASILVAHGMALFNKFSIHDDIQFLFLNGTGTNLGRWGIDVLRNVMAFFWGKNGASGIYSLPLLSGLYITLFLSATLYIIVKLADIKSRVSCCLISLLFICSPYFTTLCGYFFTVPDYMFSLLLSVLAAYLICVYKRWYTYIGAILLMVFSLSIYQAFFSFLLTAIMLYYIRECLQNKMSWKSFIGKGIYYAFACALAMGLYLLSVKVSLYITHTELSAYQGINEAATRSVGVYISGIVSAYYNFYDPDIMFPLNMMVLYKIALILAIVLFLHKTYTLFLRNKVQALQFVVLTVLFPLAINIIYVMAANADVQKIDIHNLMLFSQLMIFVYISLLFENSGFKQKEKLNMVNMAVMALIALMYCRLANIMYLKGQLMQTRAINYFTTLVAQIKNTPGYKDEYPVVYLNEFDKNDKNVQDLPFMKYGMYPYFGTKYIINDYAWRKFMHVWLAYNPEIGNLHNFENLPEVKDMPHYPDYGSIRIVNNTVVIKF